MSLVRDGLGATITNSPAAEQFWAPGAIRARRIVRPEITRTISLARPSKRSLSFAAQAVYAFRDRGGQERTLAGHAASLIGRPIAVVPTPSSATVVFSGRGSPERGRVVA
jgi:hypothetical protein